MLLCAKIDEFTQKAEKLDAELKSAGKTTIGAKSSDGSEVLCKHKGEPTFAHGLCRDCYAEVTPCVDFL